MSYKNKSRSKLTYGICNYCGLNIWHKVHAKKWGCCSRNCLDSFEILIGKQDHELAGELRWKHKKYGGNIYTTIRWLRLRKFILKRDRKCLKCGSNENLHVDHILPISHGKGHYWDFKNLQTLCRNCNMEKGTKIVAYDPKYEAPADVVRYLKVIRRKGKTKPVTKSEPKPKIKKPKPTASKVKFSERKEWNYSVIITKKQQT